LEDADGGADGRDHGPLPGLAVSGGGSVVAAGGLELDAVQPVADRTSAVIVWRGTAPWLEVEDLGWTEPAEVGDHDQAGCAQAQREGRGLVIADRAGPWLSVELPGDRGAQRRGAVGRELGAAQRVAGLGDARAGCPGEVGD